MAPILDQNIIPGLDESMSDQEQYSHDVSKRPEEATLDDYDGNMHAVSVPTEKQDRTEKIFVGGVPSDTTKDEFRNYFGHFGKVVDARLIADRGTGRARGFGFITYEGSDGVDRAMAKQAGDGGRLEFAGQQVEVKPAMPKHRIQSHSCGSSAYSIHGSTSFGGIPHPGASHFGPVSSARAGPRSAAAGQYCFGHSGFVGYSGVGGDIESVGSYGSVGGVGGGFDDAFGPFNASGM
ncbi:hypothetical protein HK097_005461 [Rhizophlyctis rosea]|uniref:RRM domain-containing protein n=1 Tax=Rhizophlyctis rosea TaxID=64517 RepID=A0AAD5S1F6_9FUNG|nr:hypothetical protein HK097_005461 [Rhizophlyctis rosea]